ncbi:hypothetical protein F0L68_37235, partial [Solihabitans fulvus]
THLTRPTRTAASQAADYAKAAAKAANEAADQAGHAVDAAKQATDHANAASVAAKAATDAAAQATKVFDAARAADDVRLAVQADQADSDARAAFAAIDNLRGALAWDAAEAARRDAETNRLIAEATSPGADRAVVVADGRKVALRLATTGGPWTKAAATAALSGSDIEVAEFVRNGIPVAAGQDDRVILTSLALTGTEDMRAAATTALAGTDADVQTFLQNRDYDGREIDDRIQINKIMAAARAAGGTVLVQTAQEALRANTDKARRQFLSADQYTAAAQDDRIRVNKVMSAGGREVKAAAQAALDGPPTMLRQFLDIGQYAAARRDQNTAAHNALVAGLVAQATQAAAMATHDAYDAHAAAARAWGAAKDADTYARQAIDAAKDADTYAQQAAGSARDAENFARQAADSAKTAWTAATAAQDSAAQAANSAVLADASANQAAGYATNAYNKAKDAYASAKAAGKDAKDAIDAATDATKSVIAKASNEKEKQEKAGIEACKASIPDSSSKEYTQCVWLAAGTDSERATVIAIRSEACAYTLPAGSPAFQNCISMRNILSANFAPTTWMKYLPDLKNLDLRALAIGTLVTVGLVALTIVCEPCGAIAGGALLSVAPEGAALAAWLPMTAGGLLAGAEVGAGVITARAVSAQLEATTVETQAAQAKLAGQVAKIADDSSGLTTLDHIALGLESSDIEKFAKTLGARTLMNDKDWRGTVWTAGELLQVYPSSFRVSFSLDGMEGVDKGVESAVGTAILRNARQIGGATDLELAFFKDLGVLAKVDFYIGGKLQANPF